MDKIMTRLFLEESQGMTRVTMAQQKTKTKKRTVMIAMPFSEELRMYNLTSWLFNNIYRLLQSYFILYQFTYVSNNSIINK